MLQLPESVDSKNQIIVAQHLTQNANDKNELKKEVDEIKDNTDKTLEKISAYSGYRSSDNILALEENKICRSLNMSQVRRQYEDYCIYRGL